MGGGGRERERERERESYHDEQDLGPLDLQEIILIIIINSCIAL